jgi:DHA3 family macrolide efflux protein-like MFS transporter
MLAGSLLLGMVGGRLNHMRAISFSIAAYGRAPCSQGCRPLKLSVFCDLCLFHGDCQPLFYGVQVAVFQIRVREDYLGRVLSLKQLGRHAGASVGTFTFGTFCRQNGINIWFVTAGLRLLLAFVSLMLPAMRHEATVPAS